MPTPTLRKSAKCWNNSFEALMQDGTTVTVPWSGMSWARPYRNANSVGNAPSRSGTDCKS